MNAEYFTGALILACIGAYFIYRNNLKIRQANAATKFRSNINSCDFSKFRGHALVNILARDFLIYKSAVSEFRLHLNPIQRRGFDKAWSDYHGGNEDAPDFLVLYGIPENGCETLKHNIDSILKFANQT